MLVGYIKRKLMGVKMILQKLVGGGCHLNRKIDALVLEAGFEIERLENVYMKGLKIGTYLYKGVAVTT